MLRPKSSSDFVESSPPSGSVRQTRKEPGSVQFRWSTNRERSVKINDSQRQDSVAALDRIEKSIWDLAASPKREQHPQRSLFVRWTWARIKQDARTLVHTVRSYPMVALMPLVLWMLMMGGGIYAVVGAADRESQHRRELATQIASDKALFLATELAKVFLPAYVCSVYVRRDPTWGVVNSSFAPMALEMIRLSNAGSILTLSLIPDGVIYTMVPLNGTSPADDPNWRAIGKDWLQDKFNEDKVLQAINSTELTIIGPYNLTQGGIGLVAMLSIRIPDVPPDVSFATPPYVHGALGPWQQPPRVQTGPNTTGTPFAPYMYIPYGNTSLTNTSAIASSSSSSANSSSSSNSSTSSRSTTRGSKWWGLTTVLISWDTLRESVMRLQDLETLGYRYVLARPALRKELLRARPDLADSPHQLAVAWSSSVQPVPPEATNNGARPTRPGAARPLLYYDLHTRLTRPAVAGVSVEGAVLTLYLEPLGGWVPSWRDPLLAVVAAGSLLLAAMLFTILLNRRQHLGLLHAMIPKKVISTIRRGDIFTESFDCVTILFSDIVSYTSMSAQMAPIEVVQMLDELYKEYDNLTEKHKLYKVETIGDAFMVVGGAPEPMAAVDAARRVAQMALDMVELTRTRVLSGGQVLRIRVGIHSGPVVAAVVGRKMPRYCLFGDTVNTASRMESNGSPMRIHVSGATADLLREAGGFGLDARGDVPIKGKGSMSTFWVTGAAATATATAVASTGGAAAVGSGLDSPITNSGQQSLRSLLQPPQCPLRELRSSGATAPPQTAVAAVAAERPPTAGSMPLLVLPVALPSPPPPRMGSSLSRPPQLASLSRSPSPSQPQLSSASAALRRDLEMAMEAGCRDGEPGSPRPPQVAPRGVRLMTAASSPLRVSSSQVVPKVAPERNGSVDLDAISSAECSMPPTATITQTNSSIT